MAMRGIGQATISPGYGEPGILLDGLSNIRKEEIQLSGPAGNTHCGPPLSFRQ
jgi:hypothetical protein